MIPPANEGRRPVRGRLIAAREAKGLDRAAAAKLAKVPLRFAEMLEEGKYSLVADPAYLVPYLRRYAATLEISPDALVMAFHQENELADRMAPLPNVLEMPVGPSRRRRLQRLATLGAFFGGVAVTFVLLSVQGVKVDFSLEGWSAPFDGWLARMPFGRKTDAVASPSLAAVPTAIAPTPAAVQVAREQSQPRPAPAAQPRASVTGAPLPAVTVAPAQVIPTSAPRAAATSTPQALARPTAAATPVALARAVVPPAPVRPTAAPTAAAHPSARSGGYRLELTGTARQVWIWISVDGGRRRAVEIRRGSRVSFDATREFLLSLDDAGGVDAKLNGQPLPPLGGAGEARRNLRFPDG